MSAAMQRLAGSTRRFAIDMLHQVQDDDVVGLSAELAYRWFLTLFPFAIFIAGLGAFIARVLDVQNPAQIAMDQLTGLLPPDAAALVGDELNRIIGNQDAGLISFGLVAAIWFATGGTNAVIKAMNRAYDVDETRPLWRRYLLALGMTVLAGVALVTAVVLYVVGQVMATDLAGQLGVADATAATIAVLRWPIAATVLFVAIVVLYRLGPNLRLEPRWIMPGAAFFTFGWLAATAAFGWYVSSLSDYGATFGALAGVAVLMLWFYLTAFMLLIGAEINGVLVEMNEPENVAARRTEAGSWPRVASLQEAVARARKRFWRRHAG